MISRNSFAVLAKDATAVDETMGHKHRYLRDHHRNGIDMNRNKFVVDPPAATANLFNNSETVSPWIVDGQEVFPRRKYGVSLVFVLFCCAYHHLV